MPNTQKSNFDVRSFLSKIFCVKRFLSHIIENAVMKLVNAECVRLDKSDELGISDALTITPYGQIASYY